jgi:magnesium-transporting ATPase (P-type)
MSPFGLFLVEPLTCCGVCVQVGIKGEEGLQAVNSSDYAIAQFRFLSDLLLKHGRYNYIRMSNSVCYIFYKNILMSITQFWFNFSCAFSGQKYYTEGAIQLYNFLYSNLPLLMLGIYDTDIAPASAHKYPQIYLSGINDDYFKVRFCIFVLVLLYTGVRIEAMHASDCKRLATEPYMSTIRNLSTCSCVPPP